jgi:2-methylcitrate dehydratase PrpD
MLADSSFISAEVYAARVDYPKGSMENPMSDDELKVTFESLAAQR